MPCDALDTVRRLLPRSYCTGRWDALLGRTVYRVYSGDKGVIGTGLSAQQAWKGAAALLESAAGAGDEGDRYLQGRDVQELIGKQLREQGR